MRREDPPVVQALAELKLDSEVPEPLWRAVAETLAWAHRLQGGHPVAGLDEFVMLAV